jgi:hypothetical protein
MNFLLEKQTMTQNQTLRGYQIKNRKGLNHWEPLLEEWLLCTERYCRVAAGEDAPFIYTERANIGVLAGAAWRCGRAALEEFQYKKGYRNKPKWNGRADLYFISENREEMIEGKFGWLSLASPKNAPKRVEAVLAIAISDTKKTKGTHIGTSCLAVAFLPTWLPAKRSDVLEKRIVETISSLIDSDFHAVAWCFPKEYRRIESDMGNYTPGIVMAVSNPEIL